MKVAFYLAHPAHYHYFKVSAQQLRNNGHDVVFLAKNKDILLSLLDNAGEKYEIIANRKSHNYFHHILYAIQADIAVARFLRRERIDVIVGSQLTGLIRKMTNAAILNTGEDDAKLLGIYPLLAYKHTNAILSPACCDNGRWNYKSIKFPGFLEFAYLHPNHFTPSRMVVEEYGIEVDKPYFVLRFASLNAHHDSGIKGINAEVAQRLVDILSPHGRIYITSERPLEPQFEQYRIKINPLDMHHVMAFASLYIGDSQTMAAEAGVLGVPFVRFNDFVGRIGYLRELEDVYELGYGIHATPLAPDSPIRRADGSKQPSGVKTLYERVEQLVSMSADELTATYQSRRQKMLSDKIDCAKFLTWFIENYPASAEETRRVDDKFWEQFK